MRDSKRTVYQLRDIPKPLWKKFKIRLLMDNIDTYNEGLLLLIREYVNQSSDYSIEELLRMKGEEIET